MSSTRCTRGSASGSSFSESEEDSGTESLEGDNGDKDDGKDDGKDGGKDDCCSKMPSDVIGDELYLQDDGDEGRLEYEALMAINGALRRALSDRDAQLREMARRAKQEQKRLHDQLKEAMEAHLPEVAAAPGANKSEASAGGDPAAGKVLKLTRRVQQMSQELRAQQSRTREALAQAQELEEQLLRVEEAPSDHVEEGGGGDGDGDGGVEGGDSADGGDEDDAGSFGDGAESGVGGAVLATAAAAAATGPGAEGGGGEETLERVNEQLQRTTQRLVDLRSHNMQLRHDLMLAKKVLAAEVGETAAAAALAASSGGGWKGRAEQIATLSQKSSEMQEQLQQLRQECAQMRQRLKESSSTEDDLLRPVTQVSVTPREVSPPAPLVTSMSTLPSVPDAGAAGPGAGAGTGVSRAAAERRAAAEAAAREASAAEEAAEWQADLHKAHNVALEANAHALRERIAQLLAKAQHDKQLAQAVTEQVNAAETQVRNRERKLELSCENFAQERRMLQQQLVRSKSVATHLQGVLAEKEKVLKDLSGCTREIDERESARFRAKNRGNVSSATRSRGDRARAAMLRVVLNGRTAERARLQHLVDHLDRRMTEKQQELQATNEALRSERQRTASLETDIARLELQRGGGGAGGGGGGAGGGGRLVGGGNSGRDRAAPDDFRSRLYLMEEENEALRMRLERLFLERDEELRTYAAILDPKKALTTPTRAASTTNCSAGPTPAQGHSRSSGTEIQAERKNKRSSASVGRLGRGQGPRVRPS